MTKEEDLTDEGPSAYGAFGKLVSTTELRQQIQGMIDPESEQYHPWRAMRLMHEAVEKHWWKEQERLRDRGYPYQTDVPDWVYPASLIDNGDEGLQLQYAQAYRHTFNYLDHGLLPNREQASPRTFKHHSGCDLPGFPDPSKSLFGYRL